MGAVILDRDGVINQDSDNYIRSVHEWQPLPGSIDAIARLSRAGWLVAVCTNQSGLARGLFTEDTLNAIHARLVELVEAAGGGIDGIFVCPHGPDDGCDCRKPRPGLLLRAAERLGFSLRDVPVIGDADRDLEAARAVGARPILVLTGKGQRTRNAGKAEDVETYQDLSAAVDALLAGTTDKNESRRKP
ncbi:MAG: D-glycero-beta-D-manno-heptose 1,7-bisphosphate 7-phosphatase [Ectothiorhodospiraceae bacterium]|nr:D-glycero-beta-D-manno-heptose 1,7-bisphosphate 7-phosphatase [Ectothiorhodospiraceae bacterium]